MTGDNNTRAQQDTSQVEKRREQTNLDGRYGEIGILAVAAAIRYAGARKNPAYAPVVHRIDLRLAEFAV